MKKFLMMIVFVSVSTAPLFAKSGIDLELGVGAWTPTLGGHLNFTGGDAAGTEVEFDDMEYEKDNGKYMYMDFNHFVPVLPNIRIEKTDYKIVGEAENIPLKVFGFLVNSDADLTIDMDQTDIIIYWSLPFVSTATGGVFDINMGLDAKKYDGTILLERKILGVSTTVEEAEIDQTLPLIYLNFILDIPFTPIKLDATTKFVSYDGAKISDNSFKLSYKLPFSNALVDVNLDVGYRIQNITIPDSLVDDLDLDMDTKGAFYGVSVKF